ncbi:neprilysin-like isoform X2 [Ornithodoros turicata]|uniref:neprilysin-like isoform X2 n=1 Tax=Ornithodoros turicata TaxID=34597 RepID=UPI003139A914
MTSNAQVENTEQDTSFPFHCSSRRRAAAYVAVAFAVCAIVAAVTATTVILLQRNHDPGSSALINDQSPAPKCDSAQCLQVSRLFENTISRDAEPCDDFYAYICEGWKTAAAQSRISTVFVLHSTNLTYAVMDNLEHTVVEDSGQNTFQKAAGLYLACLNILNGTEEDENVPGVISNFFKDRKISFVMSSTIDSVELFLDLAFRYRIPTLVDIEVENLAVLRGLLGVVVSLRDTLGRRFPETTDNIFKHLVWLGGRRSVELHTVASTIKKTDDVISAAAKIALNDNTKVPRDVSLYLLERFEKVATQKSTGRWNENMRAFSNGILPGQHYLAVKGENVVTFLNSVFKNVDSHDLGLWLGYEASLYLKQLVHHGAVDDDHKRRLLPQWKRRCLKLTSEVMHFATYSSYFYKVMPPDEADVAGLSIVNSTADAIMRRIKDSTWLDDYSKLSALRKLEMMEKNVGYPREAKDMKTLDEYYEIYPDMTSPFLKSWLRASHAHAQRIIERLQEPNQLDLNRDMSLVNAFYQPLLNQIVVPVALLTPPFFAGIPAVNYGAVGHLAAHEMMHAYDVFSSHLDEYGRKRDLWTPEVREEYGKRIQCLRHSFQEPGSSTVLTAPDDNLDSEMMADFIGVSGLYDAYRTQPRVVLEGLDQFSSDQLFFASFCFKWCSNARPASRYPEFRERCNAPLRNTEQFALAFNCSSETYMNAREKCSFW